MIAIDVQGLSKRFRNGFQALDNVSIRFDEGDLVALLGPSGSGKTTLLRVIAGLEHPTSGRILFGGEDASGRHVGERKVGFVFQHYALFRHMTVFENVAFGLRVRPSRSRPSEMVIQEKVMELLHLVQIAQFSGRYPSQLSGGQRQRVALARALAIEPRVLLLDEPFGALDAKVRKELRRWLRQLHDSMGLTSIFVTHDQEEALELADRVVVMDRGRIEQIGTPHEVYSEPATPFVYEFLGQVNRIPCQLVGGVAQILGSEQRLAESGDGPAIAYIRPHDVAIAGEHEGTGGTPAIVRHVALAGASIRIDLLVDGLEDAFEADLCRETYQHLALTGGERVWIRPRKVRLFAGAGR